MISCKISKRLNKSISNPGKISINGVFIVSIKITKTANEIIETIIYDKNLLKVIFLDFLGKSLFWIVLSFLISLSILWSNFAINDSKLSEFDGLSTVGSITFSSLFSLKLSASTILFSNL